MVETCVDPYLKDLYRIQRCVRRPHIVGEVRDFIVELRILKMFCWCLARWDDSDVEIGVTLAYMLADLEGIWVKFGEEGCDLFTPNPRQENRDRYDFHDEAISIRRDWDLLFLERGVRKVDRWGAYQMPCAPNPWDVDRDPDVVFPDVDFELFFPIRGKQKWEFRDSVWKLVSAEPGQEDDEGWDVFPAKPVQDTDDDWGLFTSCLEQMIQQCKPRIEGYGRFLLLPLLRECSNVSHNSSNVGHNFIFDILEFLDAILENLEDIIRYKADKIVRKNKEIEIHLLEKLTLLVDFLVLIANGSMDCEDLTHFNINLSTFANHAACLTFLCWVKEADEESTTELDGVFSGMLQKFIKPCVPQGSSSYFRALKAIKLHQSDTLLLGRIVAGFVDLHLENLGYRLKDDFQIVRDGLVFLLTFLVDPPQGCDKDEKLVLIRNQIDVLLSEASYLLLRSDDMKDDFVNEKMFPSGFVTTIESLKAKITLLYVKFPDSSSYDFPRTNGLGFFIFLLQHLTNLKEKLNNDAMFIPFAKYHIIKIKEEMVSLRPYFNDIVKLQKEHEELKVTWLEMIHLAYLTEYVVDFCSIILHPIWYNIACLSDILEKIKAIKRKRKLEKIKDCSMYNSGVLSESVGSSSMLVEHTCYQRNNDMVVGLEKDADFIINELTRGSRSLDFVSIVGMGGLVSQVHNTRKILLHIVNDIVGDDMQEDGDDDKICEMQEDGDDDKICKMQEDGDDDKICKMQEDELAHLLWKRLSGKRYLIVIDDIWDIEAWNGIRRSFPNNENGSRVLFTTRSKKVALDAKSKCSPHLLRFLTKDESWELLQKVVFQNEGCPPDLVKVGKKIVENCKGLPLAVVVIAGLLKRPERSLSLWTEIAEATRPYAAKEGCKDIMELSYKCLPEHLKPCFLYFGMFEEDALISTKRLMLLWMGEGFVLKSRTKNLAQEYLCDLVDRSLVIVANRSFSGEIKECRVHDIIHDFCRQKAQEDNFFQVVNGSVGSYTSNRNLYSGCRVGVKMDWESLSDVVNIGKNIRSLLYSNDRNLFVTRDSDFAKDWESLSDVVNIHKIRRSLLYSGDRDLFITQVFDFAQRILRNLNQVKVLDFEDTNLEELSFDPSFSVLIQVTSLVHLRYIAVSYCGVCVVPSSISNLWNLEILIVNNSAIVRLPETFWKMERLGHVEVGRCELDLGGDEHEPQLQLINVESFSSPTLSVENWQQLLQRLPNVRKLSCYLDLSWKCSSDRNELLAVNFLSKLESLKLYASFSGQNLSVRFPVTLKKLRLCKFRVSSIYLSAIKKLPCLVVLKIEGSPASWWEMEAVEFPNLKFLKLQSIDLVEWKASVDTFPRLEQLVLISCNNLDEIPACFAEIPTLKRIEVHHSSMGAASSAKQIQEEQKDLGNELQLIVSNPVADSKYRRQYLNRLREFVER